MRFHFAKRYAFFSATQKRISEQNDVKFLLCLAPFSFIVFDERLRGKFRAPLSLYVFKAWVNRFKVKPASPTPSSMITILSIMDKTYLFPSYSSNGSAKTKRAKRQKAVKRGLPSLSPTVEP
jgi:hypothetical protein